MRGLRTCKLAECKVVFGVLGVRSSAFGSHYIRMWEVWDIIKPPLTKMWLAPPAGGNRDLLQTQQQAWDVLGGGKRLGMHFLDGHSFQTAPLK